MRPVFDAVCQRFADAAWQLIELRHSRGNGVEARGPVTDGRSRETYLDRIYRVADETIVPDHDVHLGTNLRARQFLHLDTDHFPTLLGRSSGLPGRSVVGHEDPFPLRQLTGRSVI